MGFFFFFCSIVETMVQEKKLENQVEAWKAVGGGRGEARGADLGKCGKLERLIDVAKTCVDSKNQQDGRVC